MDLPIHFFTIVLNGQPFIRYHIDVLKKLDFPWHWHVVEGVAELKHDTAWSVGGGGRVPADSHNNGLSNDGTAEYLDQLAREFPRNVSIYRKPPGQFWEGKREMVNAPLGNIPCECLLWQIDSDELWTAEQFSAARQMFLDDPSKNAAFYWCDYFVGENLVISTRNCYSQNPNFEWLRTWRYRPGNLWLAHEPPRLMAQNGEGVWHDVAANAFNHYETESRGLVFQHYAYVTENQLRFKEQYYAYHGAVGRWKVLLAQPVFPVMLCDFFPWVRDDTMVDTAQNLGVVPLMRREWSFAPPKPQAPHKFQPPVAGTIIVDGVFFQYYNTGIARVWRTLMEHWAKEEFGSSILFLNRGGTGPTIPGIRSRTIPRHDYKRLPIDRTMLQRICDEENAAAFISTYYTTPLTTPTVFMMHDMIPEVVGADLTDPMWKEKHEGVKYASAFLCVSNNTAKDVKKFFPDLDPKTITVAHNGVSPHFAPRPEQEIERFKTKFGIKKPYLIWVGHRHGYKNGAVFFEALRKMPNRTDYELVICGSANPLEAEFVPCVEGMQVHRRRLDDDDMVAAYSGAVACVYPSKYEGFGLPVAEAMAAGCPVICCPYSSLREVGGEAPIYIGGDDPDEVIKAIDKVQKPEVRTRMITAGLVQAAKFSWPRTAATIKSVLLEMSLRPAKFKQNNIVCTPDYAIAYEKLEEEMKSAFAKLRADKRANSAALFVLAPDADADVIETLARSLQDDDPDTTQGPDIFLLTGLSVSQMKFIVEKSTSRMALDFENTQLLGTLNAGVLPPFAAPAKPREATAAV